MTKEDVDTKTAISVNQLFILASIQENIIMNMHEPRFKHLMKKRFNLVIKEIKVLNRFVNKTLVEEEMDGFDAITEEVCNMLYPLYKESEKQEE